MSGETARLAHAFQGAMEAIVSRVDAARGEPGEWLLGWRRGMNGLCARTLGVDLHYEQIGRWDLVTRPLDVVGRTPSNVLAVEYHLASLFFQMDSAIEILVFSVNSLGFALESEAFRDIRTAAGLRQIAPRDVEQLAGYSRHFPRFRTAWIAGNHTRQVVADNHDVSKHRTSIFSGGGVRDDPPVGFFERLGVRATGQNWASTAPFREVSLVPLPKEPEGGPVAFEDTIQLAELLARYRVLLGSLFAAIKADGDVLTASR